MSKLIKVKNPVITMTKTDIKEREYFIISVNHNHRGKAYVLMFAENDCGYRGRVESAGRYPESRVNRKLGYYNSGCSSLAVPCDIVEALSEPVMPGFFDDDSGRWVRNNRKNWQALIKNAIEKPKYEPKPEYKGARRRDE